MIENPPIDKINHLRNNSDILVEQSTGSSKLVLSSRKRLIAMFGQEPSLDAISDELNFACGVKLAPDDIKGSLTQPLEEDETKAVLLNKKGHSVFSGLSLPQAFSLISYLPLQERYYVLARLGYYGEELSSKTAIAVSLGKYPRSALITRTVEHSALLMMDEVLEQRFIGAGLGKQMIESTEAQIRLFEPRLRDIKSGSLQAKIVGLINDFPYDLKNLLKRLTPLQKTYLIELIKSDNEGNYIPFFQNPDDPDRSINQSVRVKLVNNLYKQILDYYERAKMRDYVSTNGFSQYTLLEKNVLSLYLGLSGEPLEFSQIVGYLGKDRSSVSSALKRSLRKLKGEKHKRLPRIGLAVKPGEYETAKNNGLLTAIEEKELALKIASGARAAEEMKSGRHLPSTRAILQSLADEGERAIEKLVEANEGLAITWADKYRNRGMDMEDLLQAARAGLVKAAKRYDGRGRFSTYAVWKIRGQLGEAIRTGSRVIHLPREKREILNRYYSVRNVMMQEFKREPTLGEVASRIGVDAGELKALLNQGQSPISYDQPIKTIGESKGLTGDEIFADQGIEDLEENANRALFREKMEELIQDFLPIQIQIFYLLSGLNNEGVKYTDEEAAKILGCTRQNVQYHWRKIKKRLKSGEVKKLLRDSL